MRSKIPFIFLVFIILAIPLFSRVEMARADTIVKFSSLDVSVSLSTGETNLVVWKDSTINIRYPVISLTSTILSSSYIRFTYSQYQLNIYEKDSKTLEYEVIFNKEPLVPSITFIMNLQNLEAYHQLPLDEEIKDLPKEWFVNATHVLDEKGEVKTYRPLNVVGSYAFYHTSKSGGAYGTGKAFHLYTPMLIDAVGNTAYCTQSIVNSSWTINFPQEFLDKAVYPLVLDPSFGFSGVGGTQDNNANYIIGSLYAGAVGTVTSISWYCGNEYSGNVKMALYKHSDLSLVSASATTGQAVVPNSWNKFTYGSTFSSEAIDYILVAWTSAGSAYCYDTGATNQMHYQGVTYGTFPSTLAPSHSNWKISIFANYTTGQTLSANVAQTIAFSESTSRASLLSRSIAQSLAFSTGASRLIELSRGISETVSFAFSSSKLSLFARSISQSIVFTLGTSKTAEFLRSASQAVAFSLSVDRVLELSRPVSQSLSFSFATSKLQEISRSIAQSLSFTVVSSKLVELTRGVSQSLVIAFTSSSLLEALRLSSQTIGISMEPERLIDLTRSITQTMDFNLGSSYLIDIIRQVSQTMSFSVEALGTSVLEYLRNISQAIDFSSTSTRLIEISRDVSQTIGFAFSSLGGINEEFARAISMIMSFTITSPGTVSPIVFEIEALAGLAVILAIAAIAIAASKKD